MTTQHLRPINKLAKCLTNLPPKNSSARIVAFPIPNIHREIEVILRIDRREFISISVREADFDLLDKRMETHRSDWQTLLQVVPLFWQAIRNVPIEQAITVSTMCYSIV
jgi:hypothetical protein